MSAICFWPSNSKDVNNLCLVMPAMYGLSNQRTPAMYRHFRNAQIVQTAV